jgi:tetratricopeptide (TPR) repeat protein
MANLTIGVSGIILTQPEVDMALSWCRARGFACQVQQQICDTVDEAAIRQAEIEEQAANRRRLQEQWEHEQRRNADAERAETERKQQEAEHHARELESARQQAEAARKQAQEVAEELRRLKEAQNRTALVQLAQRPYLLTFAVGGAFSILVISLAWRNRRSFLQWLLPSSTAPAIAASSQARAEAIENRPPRAGGAGPPPVPAPTQPVALGPSLPPPVPARPPAQSARRDTPAAVEAMELAYAYLDEVDFERMPDMASEYLNTIALASKQIAIAEKTDPDATFALEHDDGSTSVMTVNELKAHALFKEGVCHADADPRRAVRVLEQAAAIDPMQASTHYWIGLLHAQLFNKQLAIAALEKALAIDPRNIEYRKALDRARNISGAQVAFDRAASATRTSVNIARWLPLAILLFFVISLIAAINSGDTTTVVAIVGIFFCLGLILKGVDVIKAWFKANI